MNKNLKIIIVLAICIASVGCTKDVKVSQKVNEAETSEVQIKNRTEETKQKSKKPFGDFTEDAANNEKAKTEDLQPNNSQQVESKTEELQVNTSKDTNVAEFEKGKEVSKPSISNETPIQQEYDDPINYVTYSNSRYGFSIEYPDFFCIGRESDCGDAELIAYGSFNALYETIDSLYEGVISQNPNAAYKVKEEDFFVVSWIDGDMIVYQNTVVGEEMINTFIIEYPVAQK